MDEPSDAIGSGIELHSMMNAAPTIEETIMEESIPTTEPETAEQEATTAVIEEQLEEDQEVADLKQQEAPIIPELSTDRLANITSANDVPNTLGHHQQQDGNFQSCILSQSSVDAQMEKVIDNIVELSGQFAPTIEQQEGLIDKDKEVEHIQREIIGEPSISLDNSIQTAGQRGDAGQQQQKPEEPQSLSQTDKPASIESLPQLPDLTKLAHEIVPDITPLGGSSNLKIQEIDQEKLNEKSIVLDKVERLVELDQQSEPEVEEPPVKPETVEINTAPEIQEPDTPAEKLLDKPILSSSVTKEDEKRASSNRIKKEDEEETMRQEQEEIEELEQLAKQSEQISEDNSMVEDEDFSVGNQEPTPEIEKPVVETEKPPKEQPEPATSETKQTDDEDQKEADMVSRSGRPVRAVRTSRRLASPEEPKIKPEKRSNKRTHDQMEKDSAEKSPGQVIKGPIKLTLRTAASRTTICAPTRTQPTKTQPIKTPSSKTPPKKIEKVVKKPAIVTPVDDKKKYKCGDCSFSTDRLNNIVYHKKESCERTRQMFNAAVEDWKKTLASPKSNKQRFSR